MNDLISKKGNWIFVRKAPHTSPYSVKPFSIYYAQCHKVVMPEQGYMQAPGKIKYYDRKELGNTKTALKLLWLYRTDSLVDALPEQIDALKRLDHVEIECWVRILTDNGELVLLPNEYNIVKDIGAWMELIDGEHIKFNLMGGQPQNEEFQEKLFYCESRGIPKTDALKILLGEIREPNICYLTVHDEYLKYFGVDECAA